MSYLQPIEGRLVLVVQGNEPITLTLTKSYVTVSNISDPLLNQLSMILSFMMTNVFYSQLYKSGKWDGVTKLLDKRYKRFRIGLLTRVVEWLKFNDLPYKIVDNRELTWELDYSILDKPNLYVKDDGTEIILRDVQLKAIHNYFEPYEGLQLNRGMLVLPPRSGKTLTSGTLATIINRWPILFTVHTIDIAQQTKAVFDKLFGIDCGLIGDGKCDIHEQVNISTIQSIASAFRIKETFDNKEKALKDYDELRLLIARTKTLIVDEAHSSSTDMYQELPKYIDNLEHIIGLTGTPFREGGDDMLLEQFCGNIVYELSRREAIDKGYLLETDVYFIHTAPVSIDKYDDKNQEKQGVDENPEILDGVRKIVGLMEADNTSTVIIVKHRGHGKQIADMLGCVFLNGSTSGDERARVYDQLNKKEILTIVSTVTGIGVDIPTLNNVLIASIGTSKVQAFQRIRCNTPAPGKECGNVFIMVPNIIIPKTKDDKKIKNYMHLRYKKIKGIYSKEDGINVVDKEVSEI